MSSHETVPGRKSLARPVQLEFEFMKEMPPHPSLPRNGATLPHDSNGEVCTPQADLGRRFASVGHKTCRQ
jgi:hypothetical protein